MKGAAAIVLFAALAFEANAAERVTLANGFTLDCNHHAVVDGRMRLYTNTGEQSYIEFAPTEVRSFETVPDPPATEVNETAVPVTPAKALPEILSTAGQAHNLDVELLASVVKAESGGNPRARSHAGAQGLMQLMPKTATDMGVVDSYEPEQNVGGGAKYLDALLTRYHENLILALAAYNAGPQAVDRYHGIPPYRETRAYVARVIREFNRRVAQRERTQRQTASR